MQNLSLVAAVGDGGELGYHNNLIWKIKEDLDFYKDLTMGKNIIMGRKTLESMPLKALEGRHPIVLTSQNLDVCSSVETFHNIIHY